MTNYRINKLIDFLVEKKLAAEADFLIGLVKTSSGDRYRPVFCKFRFSSAVSVDDFFFAQFMGGSDD